MTSSVVSAYKSFPWTPIVKINSVWADGTSSVGTGVFISPYSILTASHVVFASNKGLAKTVTVLNNDPTSNISLPGYTVEASTASSIAYNIGYDTAGNGTIIAGDGKADTKAGSELDIAVVKLERPLGLVAGWLPYTTAFQAGQVTVAGYPSLYGSQLVQDTGNAAVNGVDASIDLSKLDVHPGDSGGPILVQTASGPQVVGVVSTTGTAVSIAGWKSWIDDKVKADFEAKTTSVGWNEVHGGSGDNRISSLKVVNNRGELVPSFLYGGAGDDTFDLRDRVDSVDGGTGNDTVLLSGRRADYTFAVLDETKSVIVTATEQSGLSMRAMPLQNVETITFADQTVAVADLSKMQPPVQAQPSGPRIAFTDHDGTSGTDALSRAGTGSPDWLEWNYFRPNGNSGAIATSTPNVFIKGGDGTDAIQVTSGRNVLDGGLGSNFLVGGTGQDVYFTDARGAQPGNGAVWNTIMNFKSGDTATVWGFVSGKSRMWWDKVDGAQGSQGATLRLDVAGTGGVDASITFAGVSMNKASAMSSGTTVVPAGPALVFFG